MENPWAGVVGSKPDGGVIAVHTQADNITVDRVHVVVGVAAGATNDIEGVAVQMDGVLDVQGQHKSRSVETVEKDLQGHQQHLQE